MNDRLKGWNNHSQIICAYNADTMYNSQNYLVLPLKLGQAGPRGFV